MYISAEVVDFQNFNPTEYISARDIELYKSNKKEVLDDLKNYLLNDGNSLDGDEIQKHLFPEENIDIFLSHSHGDEDKVIKLAILLERKGLKVFVDSCVWGNAFDLLKVIDKKYCLNTDGSAYNYDKRNYSTSHVYMMLNTALHKMIDNCEVFLFLGTPNSVSVKDGIKNEESLKSPWIFSELAFIQHVRRKSSFEPKMLKYLIDTLDTTQITMDSLHVHYQKPKLDYRINTKTLEAFLSKHYSSNIQVLRSLYSQLKKNQETPISTTGVNLFG
ncbi:toll/interleukin-1 receptor domain-containing protein [Acinetobacter baumannii]|uniref:toll/interleukin-1 receptor domain-containing protein n=1 Tax=Acinetobacter baumannii TaxID=470 RepID=UPI0009947EE8|nr:toll/interleukin-1 receptor domain-containing protein [Acinetobacter baumannii]MDX7930677.1 toll/interleukin-1 receptor domain-containing protein [Acinetobacter baumannii]OOS30982.1 hypothetical protein BTG56_06580 [Acinetobacter baumannii]HEM7796288.1 toll/interleukin-1 receptor domain-containing protein [Acinetobacter baumannii]